MNFLLLTAHGTSKTIILSLLQRRENSIFVEKLVLKLNSLIFTYFFAYQTAANVQIIPGRLIHLTSLKAAPYIPSETDNHVRETHAIISFPRRDVDRAS